MGWEEWSAPEAWKLGRFKRGSKGKKGREKRKIVKIDPSI